MKNIDEKIGLLVQDIQRLSDANKARAIKQFILAQEIQSSSVQNLTRTDLAQIHNDAASISANINPYLEIGGTRITNDNGTLQALCFSEAFYMFLRRNNLISALIGFRG